MGEAKSGRSSPRTSDPFLKRVLNDSLETLADKIFSYKSPRNRVDISQGKWGGIDGEGPSSKPHPRGLGRGGPVKSSPILQALLFYSLIMYPFWVIGMITCTIWKSQTFLLNPIYMGLSYFFLAIFILAEPVRLWLGYTGNLLEQIPELAGVMIGAILPQLPVTLYFMVVQSMVLGGFALPLEIALNALYFILLLPQPVLAYLLANRLMTDITLNFRFDHSEDFPATIYGEAGESNQNLFDEAPLKKRL